MLMDEMSFKEQFIAGFLSTWAANLYPTACASGNHKVFDHPPVEDAFTLADVVWKEYLDLLALSKEVNA